MVEEKEADQEPDKKGLGKVFEPSSRSRKALELVEEGKVELLRNGAKVENGDGDKYAVTFDFCSCPDHQFRETVCKHMRAYRLALSLAKAEGDGDE